MLGAIEPVTNPAQIVAAQAAVRAVHVSDALGPIRRSTSSSATRAHPRRSTGRLDPRRCLADRARPRPRCNGWSHATSFPTTSQHWPSRRSGIASWSPTSDGSTTAGRAHRGRVCRIRSPPRRPEPLRSAVNMSDSTSRLRPAGLSPGALSLLGAWVVGSGDRSPDRRGSGGPPPRRDARRLHRDRASPAGGACARSTCVAVVAPGVATVDEPFAIIIDHADRSSSPAPVWIEVARRPQHDWSRPSPTTLSHRLRPSGRGAFASRHDGVGGRAGARVVATPSPCRNRADPRRSPCGRTPGAGRPRRLADARRSDGRQRCEDRSTSTDRDHGDQARANRPSTGRRRCAPARSSRTTARPNRKPAGKSISTTTRGDSATRSRRGSASDTASR